MINFPLLVSKDRRERDGSLEQWPICCSPLLLASFPGLTACFSRRGMFSVKLAPWALECLQLKTCLKSSIEAFYEKSPTCPNTHRDALCRPFCFFIVFKHSHKLKLRKFCLNMRKSFFTLRVTEPWPRLPREAVESPSLEIFQTRLDKVLCSLL